MDGEEGTEAGVSGRHNERHWIQKKLELSITEIPPALACGPGSTKRLVLSLFMPPVLCETWQKRKSH